MKRDNIFWGSVLILVGVLLFLQSQGIIHNIFRYFWPLALILVGSWIILNVYWRPVRGATGETFSIPLRLEIRVDAGPSFVPFIGPSEGIWRFQVTQEIPLTMIVEAGASSLNIDLKDVLATSVELKTGASSSNVTVPARGASLLDVEAGAASVNIRVPEATAARIRIKEGVTSVNVDSNRFPRLDSGMYQSSNFDTAVDRAEINIESGLGSVSVK